VPRIDPYPARGGPISAEPRINDRIRVPEVRLVGPNGEQVGIVAIDAALRLAQEADLDLVEVAPTARPPVCKLMDYGKFKYESAVKAREARKNQAHTIIKEMKLRPKNQEGSRRAFPQGRGQSENHDHVPWT
jgi:translation initiation factor IF-3